MNPGQNSLRSPTNGSRPPTRTALRFPGWLALITLAAGVIAPFGDSLWNPLCASAPFGVLLGGWVIAMFHSRNRTRPFGGCADIRAFSRDTSRRVYLMLYAVIGIRQLMGLLRNATVPSVAWLAWGVLSLALIQALAYACARRQDHRADAAPMPRGSHEARGSHELKQC